MMVGWRRAFCTSVPAISNPRQGPETSTTAAVKEKGSSNNLSPRLGGKLGFLSASNPSTPRFHTDLVGDSPKLRCRTTPGDEPRGDTTASTNELHCKLNPTATTTTNNNNNTATDTKSPRFLSRSATPSSSPRSPSTFALLKSTLRISKTSSTSSRCGICSESMKMGQGTAIFTAECSHVFHFPCVATRMAKQTDLLCPVCDASWTEFPLLSNPPNTQTSPKHDQPLLNNYNKYVKRHDLKVYDDDEPLLSPAPRFSFNPIPESDENDNDDDFQGFFVAASAATTTPPPLLPPKGFNTVEVRLSPDAAVVSADRNCETRAVMLKVRAPPQETSSATLNPARRPPIDLVTVVDVGSSMSGGAKLQTLRSGLKLLISSLSSTDRLSIVAFSGNSKRLLPLRRMTADGRRSARRVLDGLVPGRGYAAAEAVMKAAKVIGDRRERNPIAAVVLVSYGGPDGRSSPIVSCTRFPHLDIPVYAVGLGGDGACGQAPPEEAFAKCVGGLLNVAVQDVRVQVGLLPGSAPAEIPAVYSCNGRRPAVFGPGLIRLGDLCAGEEREVLVEIKVPTSAVGTHHIVSVRCWHRDPFSQELVYGKEQPLPVPRPHGIRSSGPEIRRLRNHFVSTRAIAESRRLIERAEFTAAHHLLSSARALVEQSGSASADEFLCGLNGEIAELHRRRQLWVLQFQRARATSEEPLTPTSAWRAAERLAKVAIMRKALNRVSDLHGFENARF